MAKAKQLVYLILCSGIFLSRSDALADSPDMGFLYDRFKLTLADGCRTEIAGPAYYSETNETQAQWAMPPVWSWTSDPVTDVAEFDFAYPFLTYDRFGSEYRFQIFQLFAFAGGQNQRESHQRRFTLFPLYFQQRSPEPELNYTAVLPFYGTLKNRLFRDEIHFVLFPAYSQTRKRDLVTDNYLYPFFHLRHGDQLSGWQAWPLLGHEQKAPTLTTNRADETVVVGGHDRWFALWPFYLNNHTGLGTTNPAHEVAFIPAYSQLRSLNRDSTTVLWPFFSYVDDREKKYHEWELPWPVVIFAHGEGKTANRVWPFFSQVHNNTLESDFYLWPVYKYNRLHSDPLDRERTRILLFLYSDVIQKNTATGQHLRRVDQWPLWTYHREYNGDRRLQILAPIEPYLPNNKGVERNWSPLWSLWRSEARGDGSASSQSLLWNLYRRETAADAGKCSLLFGLFHYQSSAQGWRCRLAGLPVLWGSKTSAAKSRGEPQFQPLPGAPGGGSPRPEHPAYDAAPPAEMTGTNGPPK
jgi:hypothetical protein